MNDAPSGATAEPSAMPGSASERWSRPVAAISLCVALLWFVMVGSYVLPRMGEALSEGGVARNFLIWLAYNGTAFILLSASAVLLLRRWPSAWGFHIAYAIMGILPVLWRIENVIAESGQPHTFGGPVAVIEQPAAIQAATLLGWAYPVLVLFWFLRRKIRSDIKSWRKISGPAR